MIDLISEILNAQQSTPLGTIFHLSAMSSFLFFIPYAAMSLGQQYKSTLDTVYDGLMGVFFLGLCILAFSTVGFEGLVATAVGVALATCIYVALLSPVLLWGLAVDFVRPALNGRTA